MAIKAMIPHTVKQRRSLPSAMADFVLLDIDRGIHRLRRDTQRCIVSCHEEIHPRLATQAVFRKKLDFVLVV